MLELTAVQEQELPFGKVIAYTDGKTGWLATPQGKDIAYIPTARPQVDVKEPSGIPANVCFGSGDDSKTLYVTVDKSLYRIRLKIDGYHIPFEK